MTTLILMRHGETDSNIAQIYQGQGEGMLTKKGIEQAKLASKYLSDVKIDAVYCSALIRSLDTAKIMAAPHGLNVKCECDLNERYYGDWEGLTFNYIYGKYKKLYNKWLVEPAKARIPNAESLKALQKRGVSAIERIVKTNKNKTILIVAHGGLNRTILFHYLGLDLNNFWKIKQDNCGINIIEILKPYSRVALINSTSHLGKLNLKKKDVLS